MPADRRAWRREARRPRLRAMPSADRRRPSGIRKPRRAAGELHRPPDGGVQERRAQGRPRRRDGRDGEGAVRRRGEGGGGLFRGAEAHARLQQGASRPTRCRGAMSARAACASRSPTAATSRSAAASSCCRTDAERAALRDPKSGFTDFVAKGSIAKGAALAAGGDGKTIACATCHGPALKGLGEVPGITGRPATYIFRQLNDMKTGNRSGALGRTDEAGGRQARPGRHDRAGGVSRLARSVMAQFKNLGDLIDRDRDLTKVAIIDLGGEEAPTRIHLRRARRHDDRRRARAGQARLRARRPHRDPLGQPRRIHRGLFRHHARGLRRGAGELPVSAEDHPFHHPGCRRQARVLRHARAATNCPDGLAGRRVRRARARGLRPLRRSGRVRDRRCRSSASRRCSSTRRARPACRRASCSRTRATSGWWRRGSRPTSNAIAI